MKSWRTMNQEQIRTTVMNMIKKNLKISSATEISRIIFIQDNLRDKCMEIKFKIMMNIINIYISSSTFLFLFKEKINRNKRAYIVIKGFNQVKIVNSILRKTKICMEQLDHLVIKKMISVSTLSSSSNKMQMITHQEWPASRRLIKTCSIQI